ncbi:MAG: DUF1570 domain-containing protein [Planctomycetota bacterium]|jgi:outer membrane biosynthesis protein TonB
MKARFLALLFSVLLFSLIVPASIASADMVIRKDGRRIEGKILEINEDWVVIETKYGEVVIDQEHIARIIREGADEPEEKPEEKPDPEPTEKPEPEPGKEPKPAEKPEEKPKDKPEDKPSSAYEKRYAEAKKKNTADAWVELAEWCQDVGKDMEGLQALKKAIQIDPDHAEAREYLGYVPTEDGWLSENEALKKGMVRGEDGTWRKPKKPEPKKKDRPKPVDEKVLKEFFKETDGVPWPSRFTSRSRHYEVNCNVSKEAANTYSKVLEALFKRYSKIFAALNPKQDRPCTVNIHRNYDEFRQTYGAPPGAGGRYEYGKNRIVAFHGYMGPTSLSTFQILAHEGTHQFQDLFIKGNNSAFPVWVIEGMAVVFESSIIDPKKGTVELVGLTDVRVKQLQEAVQKGTHVTLKQMLETPQTGFTGSQYNTAGTFTWWLLKDSNEKKYKQLYEKYLLQLVDKARRTGRRGGGFPADDGSFAKLVDEILGKSIQDLEQEWQKYVLGL